MIRVLHVIGSLNNGGSQAMVMSLYRNIDRSKIQFDFVIHRSNELYFADEISNLGGKIYSMPPLSFNNIQSFQRNWSSFFKKYPEYKIIHGHVRSTAAIYLNIAKKHGLVTIAHSHSTSSGKGLSALIKNIMQYPIRYVADYLFACSEAAGIWLFGKTACSSKKFYIIKNAIDCEKYLFNPEIRKEIRNTYNLHGKFVVGHVGRFCYPKNHKFLIKVFEQIHKKNNNSVLVLVGDGELKNSILDEVHKLGLDDCVMFLGNRSNVNELLQGMDCFVFPSLFEGLGISVIEAQAAGLPCVVSNNLPEEVFITNLIKKLSLKNNPIEWSKVINKNNENQLRTEMRVEIRKSGYEINENTNWIEKFYVDIY